MLHYFSLLAPRLNTDVVTLHDFQLSPARRPKVLVQTAGHVSGAATFYQPKVSLAQTSDNVSVSQSDVQNYPELADKKYYPVCHHPVWGGWFALRGVAILPGTRVNLPRPQLDQSLSPDQAVDMITLYNECWQVHNTYIYFIKLNFQFLFPFLFEAHCLLLHFLPLFFFCF